MTTHKHHQNRSSLTVCHKENYGAFHSSFVRNNICEPHHVVKDDIVIVVSQKIEYIALIEFGWGCLSFASIHYKTGLNLID